MLRQTSKRRSYVVTSKPTEKITTAEVNTKMVDLVTSLMIEENVRTQLNFDKVSPLVNEIFCALANYDIRFDFEPLSLESCLIEKATASEYNLLCPLKELPGENLRLEGIERSGVLTVRLSQAYEDSIDKVCWEDVSLPPDGKGYRCFSTKRLLNVLSEGLKHAINDVIPSDEENNDTEKSVRCKQTNNMVCLDVKVPGHSLRINFLPCIPLNDQIMKSLLINARIRRATKLMKLETTECPYLVAKPLPKMSENLWRITVNNIENNILRKIFDLTDCASHCMYALTLLSEKFFLENINKSLVPYYLIHMVLLEEFLKFPKEKHWKSEKFTHRVEDVLGSLESHLRKRNLKNIFSGMNTIAHREDDNLTELVRDVSRLRTQFREYLSNIFSKD